MIPNLKQRYQEALHCDKHYALINMNIKKYRYMVYAYGRSHAKQVLNKVEYILRQHICEDDTLLKDDRDDFFILKTYETRLQLEKDWLYGVVDDLFEIDDPCACHNIYTSFGIFLLEDEGCPFEEAFDKVKFCRLSCISIKMRVFCYEFYDENVLNNYLKKCRLEEITAQAKRDNQFQIYIQPKIDLKTRKICGGEALLRLFYDEQMIPVSDFLPVLNENGFIRLIDLNVCETIVRRIMERKEEGKKNVRISLNISNSYFYDEYFLEDYFDIMERYSMDTDFLEMEFMESIHMDEERLRYYIDAFHEKGFHCALDDFGNGYSNFNLLSSSNVDTVKIDRAFFTNRTDKHSREVLKTIVHLIKVIGMQTVAEGVEEKEDIDFLTEIGCDYVQGFYFYKPMPMEDFFQLLDEF